MPLPAGELRRIAIEIGLNVQQRGRARHLPLDARGIRPGHAQAEADILPDRHVRKDRVVLEHHGQPALARRQRRDVAPADFHAAGRLCLQPGNDPQQCGLAAARRAEKGEELAICNVQVDARERNKAAERLGDVVDDDVGHLSACSSVGNPPHRKEALADEKDKKHRGDNQHEAAGELHMQRALGQNG